MKGATPDPSNPFRELRPTSSAVCWPTGSCGRVAKISAKAGRWPFRARNAVSVPRAPAGAWRIRRPPGGQRAATGAGAAVCTEFSPRSSLPAGLGRRVGFGRTGGVPERSRSLVSTTGAGRRVCQGALWFRHLRTAIRLILERESPRTLLMLDGVYVDGDEGLSSCRRRR